MGTSTFWPYKKIEWALKLNEMVFIIKRVWNFWSVWNLTQKVRFCVFMGEEFGILGKKLLKKTGRFWIWEFQQISRLLHRVRSVPQLFFWNFYYDLSLEKIHFHNLKRNVLCFLFKSRRQRMTLHFLFIFLVPNPNLYLIFY